METHEQSVARARRGGTPEQIFACDLAAEALRLTGVEVLHVVPSLHVTGGIEMCFRQPCHKRADWPEYGYRAFGFSASVERIVLLIQSLHQCKPNDVEQAIGRAR